ncbi:hypothetical protein BH09CHL1_BH09CHL1_31620 [soil metagenome]
MHDPGYLDYPRKHSVINVVWVDKEPPKISIGPLAIGSDFCIFRNQVKHFIESIVTFKCLLESPNLGTVKENGVQIS